MADFSEIYKEHIKKVYRFLLALTENETLAEELTQQTFYKAFLNIDRFEGRSSIYTWLCQIGKNEWLLECRRYRKLSFDTFGDIADEREMEEDLVRKNQVTLAKQALLKLPDPYKDVLILRIYGNLPFAEIAATFNYSESWAKVTFLRGKQKLKKEMEETL